MSGELIVNSTLIGLACLVFVVLCVLLVKGVRFGFCTFGVHAYSAIGCDCIRRCRWCHAYTIDRSQLHEEKLIHGVATRLLSLARQCDKEGVGWEQTSTSPEGATGEYDHYKYTARPRIVEEVRDLFCTVPDDLKPRLVADLARRSTDKRAGCVRESFSRALEPTVVSALYPRTIVTSLDS
jgi:hypothetical protein